MNVNEFDDEALKAEDRYVPLDKVERKTCFNFAPYLNDKAAQNLKEFKYSGGDSGFAYRYFFNPAATYLVECIPDWIAPNVLTLVGFLFTVIPFVVLFT